jgi:hypothetical protein
LSVQADEWGCDPSVRRMREVFVWMEKAQAGLMKSLAISPLDTRLRHAREEALTCFERTWPVAARRGLVGTEAEVASLYLHCLSRGMRLSGIEVPRDLPQRNEEIVRLIQEESL